MWWTWRRSCVGCLLQYFICILYLSGVNAFRKFLNIQIFSTNQISISWRSKRSIFPSGQHRGANKQDYLHICSFRNEWEYQLWRHQTFSQWTADGRPAAPRFYPPVHYVPSRAVPSLQPEFSNFRIILVLFEKCQWSLRLLLQKRFVTFLK